MVDKISPRSQHHSSDSIEDEGTADIVCEKPTESPEVEISNVTEKSSDRAISCNLLQEEIYRRKLAENSLEQLSRTCGKHMEMVSNQNQEFTDTQIQLDILTVEHQALFERSEYLQEQVDSFSDIGDVTKLRRKLRHDEELIRQLKNQIIDDRAEHREEIEEVQEQYSQQIHLIAKQMAILEEQLDHATSENKAFKMKLGLTKSDNDVDLVEKVEKLEKNYEDKETQFECLSDEENKNLKCKSTKQIDTQEKIIDRLENELKKTVESKSTAAREYENTIRELESRVVNESTNASRAENDLAVAENRFKEASNDIKYFRQQFIETEQKLQVNQLQLSKTMEQLRITQSVDNTDAMSVISDTTIDDKSTICESSCVSASTSVENFVSDRRRQPGDVTDYTDDENCWYNQSNLRSQSLDSMSAVSGYVNGGGGGSGSSHSLPAGLIPIKRTTDPESNEQQISIVDSRRPPARRPRRKYGKPSDLTPSSSVTTIAIDGRENQHHLYQPQYHQQPQHQPQFSRNISELDRSTLEKQYAGIRQHRNSLIRENTFLKSKCHGLKHDLLFTERNLQNLSLEAEHKIAMLLMALNNQEYVSTQDLNALLHMFPTNQQGLYSQYHQQKQSPGGGHYHPNDKNAACLSPYAAEYQPNMYQQMYIPPDGVQYVEYNHPHPHHHQQQQGSSHVNGNGNYLMAVPSQLPETPLPQDVIDAANQLAAIGIPISKTF